MADKLDQLKQKYQPAFRIIEQEQVRLENVNMQGEKLFVRGVAPSQDAKNKVWDEIKRIEPDYHDLTCDITVSEQAPVSETRTAAAGGAMGQAQVNTQTAADAQQTYIVQPGDTLSKIAQRYYGNAGEYSRIFEANRGQLSDPNKIQPGQNLVIPKP